MFKNVASQKFYVFAYDSTTNAPKTGDAANITAYVAKDWGSATVLGDTSAAEVDATNAKGMYVFDATQGETNGDTLMVSAKSSTSNIVVMGAPAVIFTFPTTGILAPATSGRTLVVDAAGLADANAVKIGPTGSGTAQTAGDVGIKTGFTLSATGSAAMTEGYPADGATGTLAQLMYLMLAFLQEKNVSGTTVTTKKLDGSTTAATYTLDSSSAPTTITRAT